VASEAQDRESVADDCPKTIMLMLSTMVTSRLLNKARSPRLGHETAASPDPLV